MLSTNTSNKLTFSVNVLGTASLPTVRCVIGDNLIFPAVKVQDEWEALVNVPETMCGMVPFKIEVLLNGRLFTPVNTTIEVCNKVSEPIPDPVPEPTVQATPFVSEPEPIQITEPEATPVQQLNEPNIKRVKISLTDIFKSTDIPEVKKTEALKPVKSTLPPMNSKLSMPKSKAKKVEEQQTQIKSQVPITVTKGKVIYR